MRWTLLCASLALVLAGCTADSPESARPAPTTAPLATTTAATGLVAPASEGGICGAEAGRYVASGLVGTFGESEGDAARLDQITWTSDETCDRVVLSLATRRGAPARSLGPASAFFTKELGVVRIDLPPGVVEAAVLDSLIDGTLVGRAYVVRTVSNSLAIDLHLDTDEAVVVRSTAADDPARIVVDVARSTEETGRLASPATGEGVVTMFPLGGPAEYPLFVSGYTRSPGVVSRLEQNGVIVEERPITDSAAPGMWQEYEVTYATGPSGDVMLFIGRDGSDGDSRGVSVLLDIA